MTQLTLSFHNDLEAHGEMMTSSSQGDSPANLIAQQGNGLVKRMSATSGQKCLDSFQRLSRPTVWAKMFAGYLLGMEGWSSRRCRLIWKLCHTKYNRSYFQLRVLALRTKDIECGLLPTPRANESTEGIETIQARRERTGIGMMNLTAAIQVRLLKTPCTADAYTENLSKKETKFGNSGTLAQEVASGFIYQRGLLPTPTTQEPSSECEVTGTGRRKTKDGKDSHSLNLGRIVGMLPTPMADDNPAKNTGKRNQNGLQKMAYETSGQTSQLNPLFVCEMMGFPIDWLTSPFQSGETKV
jgi:hypothetical protein